MEIKLVIKMLVLSTRVVHFLITPLVHFLVDFHINVNSSNFKIEKIELSKSSDAKSLALSEKCTINEVTVVDNVYDKEENSKDITTTDVSTNAVSVDLSLNSLTEYSCPF